MKLLNHLARGMATLGEAGDEPGCTPDVRVILQRSFGWLETAQREGYELKAALRRLERALPHHDALGPPSGDPTAVLEDAAEALEIADVLCASLAHVLAHGSHPSETCSDCNRGRVAIAWWMDVERSAEECTFIDDDIKFEDPAVGGELRAICYRCSAVLEPGAVAGSDCVDCAADDDGEEEE